MLNKNSDIITEKKDNTFNFSVYNKISKDVFILNK